MPIQWDLRGPLQGGRCESRTDGHRKSKTVLNSDNPETGPAAAGIKAINITNYFLKGHPFFRTINPLPVTFSLSPSSSNGPKVSRDDLRRKIAYRTFIQYLFSVSSRNTKQTSVNNDEDPGAMHFS